MLGKSLAAIFCGAAISVLCLGCAPQTMTGPTPVQATLDAQHTAKNVTPPMDGVEADAIYKNYIENIGKPVKPTSSMDESSAR